jgi:hypothetical protein
MNALPPLTDATASHAARLVRARALIPAWFSPDQRAEAEAALARILAGEEAPELVEAAENLVYSHSHHSPEVAVLAGVICGSPRVGAGVRGIVLRAVSTSGTLYSGTMYPALASFARRNVLAWFEAASPLTLMDEAERAVLASLPDPFEAWRGGRGFTPRQAAAGLSWTLDPEHARWFADRWSPACALVVRASFPKVAVLAYFGDPDERELVVNWRRAHGLIAVT